MEARRRLVIPTNCTAIDELLDGGLRSGELLLIYGEAETGKSTLALQLAVNCSLMGHKALFVDCEGTLRAEKVLAMSGHEPDVLDRLTIARPSSFEEFGQLVDCLGQLAESGLALVAVDTMTTFYRLRLSEGESPFKLNRELGFQVASLAEVAHEKGLAVVMTSQVRARLGQGVRTSEEALEPVANRVLRYWADLVLRLKLTGRPGLRMAVLEKGRDLKRPRPPKFFKISEEGIVDAF